MNSIISVFVSFTQTYIKQLALPLLMFFVGHRVANKSAKIKEQQQDLQNNKVTITTLKKMQEVETKAPVDKQSLLNSLFRGEF